MLNYPTRMFLQSIFILGTFVIHSKASCIDKFG